MEAFGGPLCAGLLCGVLCGGWRPALWRAVVLWTVRRPAVSSVVRGGFQAHLTLLTRLTHLLTAHLTRSVSSVSSVSSEQVGRARKRSQFPTTM